MALPKHVSTDDRILCHRMCYQLVNNNVLYEMNLAGMV